LPSGSCHFFLFPNCRPYGGIHGPADPCARRHPFCFQSPWGAVSCRLVATFQGPARRETAVDVSDDNEWACCVCFRDPEAQPLPRAIQLNGKLAAIPPVVTAGEDDTCPTVNPSKSVSLSPPKYHHRGTFCDNLMVFPCCSTEM
jgi:hypothetical protein